MLNTGETVAVSDNEGTGVDSDAGDAKCDADAMNCLGRCGRTEGVQGRSRHLRRTDTTADVMKAIRTRQDLMYRLTHLSNRRNGP